MMDGDEYETVSWNEKRMTMTTENDSYHEIDKWDNKSLRR